MEEMKIGDKLLCVWGNLWSDSISGWQFVGNDMPLLFGLGEFKAGYVGQPHIHKIQDRIPTHKTVEFFLVHMGAIEFSIYDNDKNLVESRELKAGDFVCCFDGGHGIRVLWSKTILLEVKNGPYLSDKDEKERF